MILLLGERETERTTQLLVLSRMCVPYVFILFHVTLLYINKYIYIYIYYLAG